MKNGINNPDKIVIGGDNKPVKEDEVITVFVKGEQFLVTPTDALSIMNQISGVLLAHGYSRGHTESKVKYC